MSAPPGSGAPSPEDMKRTFNNMAKNYKKGLGDIQLFAYDVVAAAPPVDADSVIHDNGSGPGIVSEVLIKQAKAGENLNIHATDVNEAMIDVLKTDSGLACVRAEVMDATKLTIPDSTFTHSFTNFVVMALTVDDATKAAAHIHRTLKPGGTAVVTTWKQFGYMSLFQDELSKVKSGAVAPQSGLMAEEWMSEETLNKVLVAGGFAADQVHIKTVSHDMPTSMWTRDGATPIIKMLVNKISGVNGLTDSEKASFEQRLDERFQKERENPAPQDMIAWLAVAKK